MSLPSRSLHQAGLAAWFDVAQDLDFHRSHTLGSVAGDGDMARSIFYRE
jgi:hypothetical protein